MNNGNIVPLIRGRTAARLAAIQALYQMDMEPVEPSVVIRQFIDLRFSDPEKFQFHNPDKKLFQEIVRGVCEKQKDLDDTIEKVLANGWSLDRLETVVRAILRAALFELTDHEDTPKAVIINEYVNITKSFYSGQEPSFVNASLDNLAKQFNR